MNKSVFGLSENAAAVFAYLFAFVSGIVVLIMEKENKVVRFAALQSTVFFLTGFLILSILGVISSWWLIGIPSALWRGFWGAQCGFLGRLCALRPLLASKLKSQLLGMFVGSM